MDSLRDTPSAQIVEANERLYALRRAAQVQRQTAVSSPSAAVVTQPERATAVSTAAAVPAPDVLPDLVAALPSHLGWESGAVTAVLRNAEWGVGNGECAVRSAGWGVGNEAGDSVLHSAFQVPHSIKLYPDIGLGMLRQEATAAGRLWLLLHHLDPAGRGALRIDSIVKTITPKSAALRLCGKRQLRNLLRAGDGLYWTRDKEYIWLRSVAKVAVGLGVTRLLGRPLSLPLSVLLDGIGTFRAHLYAAFHSGRRKETQAGSQAMPIARDTLTELSGVGRSSQRTYEAQAGVGVQTHYALGERLTAANEAERAWRQGTAVFQFCDYDGQQGKPGQTYLAWQLPNSYVGGHEQRPKGRQRRINRQLKDLVTKGTPGNVGGASGAQSSRQRYYAQGKQAIQAAARAPQQEVYWRERQAGRVMGDGRFALWRPAGGGR